MNQTKSRSSGWLFGLYVLLSLAAVFYLPTRIPLRPTTSDSYIFGYNNRIGILLLLSLAVIGALWTRGFDFKLDKPGPIRNVPRKDLAWSLIAVSIGCLLIYMLAGRFGGFGESSYEIDRVWLLSQGKIPYVDFEWPFGLALLYGPLFLHQILSITVVHAYYVFWAFNCLLGTLLLYAVVNLIDFPTASKRPIFFLLFAAWFLSIVNMGTHYTLLRYTCPLLFILIIENRLRYKNANSGLLVSLLAAAFSVVLLLISPEITIAYIFACGCIFLLHLKSLSIKGLIPIACFILTSGIVLESALHLHMLDTMRESGGGADSFPIAFAPHIVLFFASVFVCACYIVRRFSRSEIRDNTLGLLAFSIPMTAAALGRCDPGHVFLNGLGIFVSTMFYLSNNAALWRWYKRTFIVVLILLSSFAGLWFSLPSFMRCAYNILGESDRHSFIAVSIDRLGRKYLSFTSPEKKAKWEKRLDELENSVPSTGIDLSTIYADQRGGYLAPFGYRPNGFGSDLSSKVDYGRFEGFENANTADAIHRKVLEVEDNPDKALLLPEDFLQQCQVDVPAERKKISMLFLFPYLGMARHSESLRQPVCSFIQEDYKLLRPPSEQNFMYGLWVANSVEEKESPIRQ